MVRAANFRATLDAFNLVPRLGQEITERHGLHLSDMKEDSFLPVRRWLDALKEIQERVGPQVKGAVPDFTLLSWHTDRPRKNA